MVMQHDINERMDNLNEEVENIQTCIPKPHCLRNSKVYHRIHFLFFNRKNVSNRIDALESMKRISTNRNNQKLRFQILWWHHISFIWFCSSSNRNRFNRIHHTTMCNTKCCLLRGQPPSNYDDGYKVCVFFFLRSSHKKTKFLFW